MDDSMIDELSAAHASLADLFGRESERTTPTRPFAAKIWKYFIRRVNPNMPEARRVQGTCTLCGRSFICFNSGTSSLRKHLNNMHRREFELIYGVDATIGNKGRKNPVAKEPPLFQDIMQPLEFDPLLDEGLPHFDTDLSLLLDTEIKTENIVCQNGGEGEHSGDNSTRVGSSPVDGEDEMISDAAELISNKIEDATTSKCDSQPSSSSHLPNERKMKASLAQTRRAVETQRGTSKSFFHGPFGTQNPNSGITALTLVGQKMTQFAAEAPQLALEIEADLYQLLGKYQTKFLQIRNGESS